MTTREDMRIKKLDEAEKLLVAGERYLLAFIGTALGRAGAAEQLDAAREQLMIAVDDVTAEAEAEAEAEPTRNGFPRSDPRSGIWDE